MQTITDVVIIHVVLLAVSFLVLVFANKAAPLPSLPSAALDLTIPSLSLSALALPATEAYLAPSSAAPLVGTSRLHPFIEGKLPLSPKAVEPSYEEAWMPQRPGYGLIPEAPPRARPSEAKILAARAQGLEKYPYQKLAVPPAHTKLKFTVFPQPSKIAQPSKMRIFALSIQSKAKTAAVKGSTTGVREDGGKKNAEIEGSTTVEQKKAEDGMAMPSNPLLEMGNDAADDQVIEWLRTHVAMNEPLLDRCRRDTSLISNIAQVFKLWEERVRIEGSWDFDKGSRTGMDEVLALVAFTYSSLEDLSTMDATTRAYVAEALLSVTRMRDRLQWANEET